MEPASVEPASVEPTPRARRQRTVGLLLILTLVAAACGSSDGSDANADGEETLASFMGWETDEADQADAEAEWRDQEARVQEAIRECMADQGFEYLPVDQTGGTTVVHDEQDELERLETQGFGITTWYGNEEAFDAAPDEEWHDPNQELVEAMSDSEREAYYEALHGTEEEQREGATIEYDEETGEEIGYSTTGFGPGCDGEAREEVHGSQDDTQELWEELQPAFEEMNERVQADPRIVEWNEQWSGCMADAGHDYGSPQDMHERVFEEFEARLQEVMGSDGGFSDPFEGMSQDEIEAFHEESTQDEIEAFYEEAEKQRMENLDQEALTALQEEEIDLALADYECRDGEAFHELHQEVAEDYEAELIAENRELLEQLREAEGR